MNFLYKSEEEIVNHRIFQECEYLNLPNDRVEVFAFLQYNRKKMELSFSITINTINGEELIISPRQRYEFKRHLEKIMNESLKEKLPDCKINTIYITCNSLNKIVKISKIFHVYISLDKVRNILKDLLSNKRKLIAKFKKEWNYEFKVVEKNKKISTNQLPEQYEGFIQAYIDTQRYSNFSLPANVECIESIGVHVTTVTFYTKDEQVLVEFELFNKEKVTITF